MYKSNKIKMAQLKLELEICELDLEKKDLVEFITKEKSKEAQLIKLIDLRIDAMLKENTGPNDENLLKEQRDCLEDVCELNVVTAKSIIAAMKVYCVTHAEEDMKRVERMMIKGKKVLNVKTMIEAHGEVLALSPLHASAMFESTEILKFCMNFDGVEVGLSFGNPESPGADGNLLDLALQVGNPEIINCAFENAKDSDLVTIEDGIPLCLADAVMNNEIEIVKILLNKESFHPALNPLMCLLLSIRDNNLTIFTRFLPQAKTKLNSTLPNFPCPLCSAPATTLLHLAICSHKPKFVKLLVQAGCDVNSTKGHSSGYTPLMQAVSQVGNHACRGKCEDRVIAELLCAEGIDLDLEAGDEGKKFTAEDLVNNYTCPSSKKVIERAYARNNLRKKMLQRRQTQLQADQAKKGPGRKHRREKICWYCSSAENLSRCAGCRVAWYCGEECQGEDWEVHGDWCVQKGRKRKEKQEKKLSENV